MKLRLLILTFTLLCRFHLPAQNKVVNAGLTVNFTRYSAEEGMPIVSVRSIYEDRKKQIWIGGIGGLCVFNGKTFRTYESEDGIDARDVLGFNEDAEGRIWVAANSGIYYREGDRFFLADSTTGLDLKQITWCIFTDTDGTMWAGGNRYILHFDPLKKGNKLIKRYAPFKSNDHNGIRSIKRKKDGSLFAGGDPGYFILEKDSFMNRSYGGPAYELAELKDGREWFSGWRSPIYQVRNNKLDSVIYVGNGVLKFCTDHEGNVWFVTWDQAVYCYNGKEFIHYGDREGLDAASFWTCICDSEGNIWLGSFGSGLFKYSGEKFTFFDEKNGLYNYNVKRIKSDTAGKIWLTGDNFITSYDPVYGQVVNYTECNGRPMGKITGLGILPNNEVIVPCYDGWGFSIDKDKITSKHWLYGFTPSVDKKGRIVFGTAGDGLHIMEDGKVAGKIRSAGKTLVNSIELKDDRGDIWFSNGYTGIFWWNGDTVLKFNGKNGFLDYSVWDIKQFNDDTYFAALNGNFYQFRFVPGQNIRITDSITSKELGDRTVNSILILRNSVILGTNRGICVFSLEHLLNGRKSFTSYTADDGLVNGTAAVHAADRNGKAWITTEKGVFIFDPNQKKRNSSKTANLLLNVKVLYKELDSLSLQYEKGNDGLPVRLDLNYDQNHITFEYIGICHASQSKVMYRYRLLGLENEWCPPNHKTEMEYSGLAPGSYTFQLRSCNNEGIWNNVPLEFMFTVHPPFWKTSWFILLCVLVFLGAVWLFIQFKQRKLKETNQRLEKKVEERTLELKHQKELVEDKNKEITDSINYASKIQGVLIPSEEELAMLFPEAFILLHPKDIVSGDFVWLDHRDDTVFLAVCDSTGHGVPGAFMSLLNMDLLSEAIREKNMKEPSKIFDHIREKLIASISKEGQKDGFDGILLAYERTSGTLRYAASNNSPVLISNGKLTNLPYDKMPVGKGEKEETFTPFSVPVKKGDLLYLYTDGFADQFGGPKGKKFKYRQLDEIILTNHKEPLKDQRKTLLKAFNDWKGIHEQVDDVCAVGIMF